LKQVRSEHGAAYWKATRDELKTAQHRADLFTLLGMSTIGALLWLNFQSEDPAGNWLMTSVALAVLAICAPLWYVTQRKRRISATRLKCDHCGYIPHDTEISEVADTLRCPHCEKPLD
jgi:hypothetical protein